MNKNKLVSSALAIATLVVMVGAPLVNVSAQTTSSLQAQIAALLAQIQTLQSQLNASGTTTTSVGANTYNFTSDLTVGSKGSAVTALQTFLIGQGDLVLATPTQYFGAMTQKALGKFQAAHGITPSAGYFGPKTRAFVNSMSTSTTTTTTTTTGTLPVGCTSSTGFSPTTGASCSTGVTVATGAPLSIAVDSGSPLSTNVAAGAVSTPVLKLDFTAGATPVTVTNLVLTRSGLSQDSDLDNVYLYNGATKLASNLGFNNGAITFSNGAGLFTVPANSTYVVTVSVDVDKGGTGTTATDSGHIFQIGLASAANVTGGTFSGNFPLNSAQFTIASVSSLGKLTISGVQVGTTTINAGQLNDLVGQMTVQASNQPVKVTSVSFTNIGNVTPSYLQNLKLMDGSTQLGATITSLGSNNIATFDLSGAPLMLTSGQSVVLSLYADITGGVGRNFQFSIQQSSDVQAVDTNYGVGIGATLDPSVNSGNFPASFAPVTIQQGNVVASRDASSPTTNVVAGNTNQVLAKFDVLASGDSIKFTQINFSVAGGQAINNFRVVDDQGAQIGSTVNLLAGSTTVSEGSGSLNYIIPANTTRVLTVYGDISATSTGSVGVTFGANGSTAQSYTTYVNASVSSVPGNTLNILPAGSNLIVSENYGLGTPVSASAGAQKVKIGSYTLTAGQVNPVNLTGVTIQVTSSVLTANPSWLTNLQVFDGSTQLGQTYATLAGGNSYTFNGNSPIAIPANGSITLDVFANVSSNITSSTATTTVGGVTSLYSVNASTQAGNAVAATSTSGQDLSFNIGGTLAGSVSAGTSQSSQLGMYPGGQGVNLAQYQFVANNNGSESLTQVVVVDSSVTASTTPHGNASDLINYRLTDTAGNVLSTASEQSGVLTFNLSGLSVPVNGTTYVNLVADTNQYPYAVSGGTHAYDLQSFQYTNATQSQTATTTITQGMGNLFTVYQTTLGITGTTGWSTPNNISGVGNTIGEFTISAGNGNMSPTLNSVRLEAAGSLIQSSTYETFGLYDAASPSVLLASSSATSTASTTFYFASTTASQWVIPFGQSKTLLVKTLAAPQGAALGSNLSGGSTGSYQILLVGATWTDGPSNDGATTTADTTPAIGLSPTISLPVPSLNITGLTN